MTRTTARHAGLILVPGAPVVGNDIVDLARGRTARIANNRRFLAKVFTASERRRIASAADPMVELWGHWAAKEAAFKVLCKTLGSAPVFEHRRFEVSTVPGAEVSAAVAAQVSTMAKVTAPSAPVATRSTRLLEVAYDGFVVRVRVKEIAPVGSVDSGPGALHAVGELAPDPGIFTGGTANTGGVVNIDVVANIEDVAKIDDAANVAYGSGCTQPPELVSASTQDRLELQERRSLAVRRETGTALAAIFEADPSAIDISRSSRRSARRAVGRHTKGISHPRVTVNGAEVPVDLSISHDGSWVAWAFTLRYQGGR